MRRDDDPGRIADHLLEVTGKAYFYEDFEAFLPWFRIPHVLGTFDGDRTISTPAELEAVFDAMCSHFRALGVLELRRKTLEAAFVDDNTVQSTFVSRYLLPGGVYSEETMAHGLARWSGERWQVAESRYATSNDGINRALHKRITDPLARHSGWA